MKKMNIIELAIKSMDINTIAENISNLGVEIWQAERIINGLPEIDVEKLKAKIAESENREYISHEIINALRNESCIYVTYRYPRTIFWNREYTMPEGIECVDREEYNTMYSKASYSYTQQGEYQYKMVYWEIGSTSYTPENL